ncbi:DUF6344 domain-containing protein [Streptomyces celluloflavus]|uniref:DUF6344 domain-containing protein n=1 Tax=Streptomyces celluloflavus TaxID=58344 RepID=UPI00364EE061
MAATKVMKFWAVCLAVLGRLLASLGVSAPASAARREAARYAPAPRTGTPAATSAAPPAALPAPGTTGDAPRTTGHEPCTAAPVPDHEPEVATRTAPVRICAPRYELGAYDLPLAATTQLPPTIKQRIRAEAHGSSPTSRSRLATGAESLHTVPAGTALHTDVHPDALPPAIPAARRREHTDCTA